MSDIRLVAQKAKAAFEDSQIIEEEDRVYALKSLRQALLLAKDSILEANAKDVEKAKFAGADGNMSSSLLKRLDLLATPSKFDDMLDGVEQVAALPDPNNVIQLGVQMDDDLQLFQVACPIGVLLVIFEARPEVIVNITALAIKSGNAAILKGGKESLETQAVLTKVIHAALSTTKVPPAFIQTVESRQQISELLNLHQYIDLVIPRGSNSLVRSIQESTKIPVMGHADGICSVYLDASACSTKAARIVVDAKTSYVAACNAVETLLVHESLINTKWPLLAETLLSKNISLRCDPATKDALSSILSQSEKYSKLVQVAHAEDYDTEFLDYILAVKSVESTMAAIKHINTHGSRHTDVIITESDQSARLFTKMVDAAGVYVNASTRFADGFRYGFGTEVGVSTNKTHARGPVGLQGLMIYKYLIKGTGSEGHITTEYGNGPGQRHFKHEAITEMKAPPF